MTPVADQIRTELDRAICGPVRSLLGHDLATMCAGRIAQRAPGWARDLADGTRIRAQGTAQALYGALWADQEPDGSWWATALGRAVGRSLGGDTAVSVATAVDALGISRQRVHALMGEGKLDEREGRVTLASVLRRLG